MTLGVGNVLKRLLHGDRQRTPSAEALRFRAAREPNLAALSDADVRALAKRAESDPMMQRALKEADALREQGSESRSPSDLSNSTHHDG